MSYPLGGEQQLELVVSLTIYPPPFLSKLITDIRLSIVRCVSYETSVMCLRLSLLIVVSLGVSLLMGTKNDPVTILRTDAHYIHPQGCLESIQRTQINNSFELR